MPHPARRRRRVEYQPFGGARQRGAACGECEAHHGTGIRQHVCDPIRRIIRVDGDEGRTGLGHRPDREHGVHGTRDGHSDEVFGTDAVPDQHSGQAGRLFVQFAIGRRVFIRNQRRRIGIHCNRGRHQLGEGTRWHRCIASPAEQFGAFGRSEHIDRVDRRGRVRGDRAQDATESAKQSASGRFVEKVGRVVEFDCEVTIGVEFRRDGELEIESRDPFGEFDGRQLQARQCEFRRAGIQIAQRNGEQRMLGLRALDAEFIDDALERDGRMGECGQICCSGFVEQIGERAGRIRICAQHQGVHEHADQVVQGRPAAARDRRADGDITGAREARQQYGECGVHHHEGRRIVPRGEFVDASSDTTTDASAHRAAPVGRDDRAWPIGRQCLLRGQIAQRVRPIGELFGQDRIQLGGLPERVIGVLCGEFRPDRCATGDSRQVGRQQVSQQWAHRVAIRRDVVQHSDKHMAGRVLAQQYRAHRHLGGDIESGAEEFGDALRHRPGRCLDRERHRGRFGGQDHLVSDAIRIGWIHGAQCLVSGDHIRERRRQCRLVQFAADAHRDRHIVGGRIRIEPVEEPHAALYRRQRYALRAWPGKQWYDLVICVRSGGQAGR